MNLKQKPLVTSYAALYVKSKPWNFYWMLVLSAAVIAQLSGMWNEAMSLKIGSNANGEVEKMKNRTSKIKEK